MSGLITSLLIEPVVRQARRLSQQPEESHPPSRLDRSGPLSNEVPNSSPENEDKGNIESTFMPGLWDERTSGLLGELAASEDGPSFPDIPSPTGFTGRDHRTEHSTLSQDIGGNNMTPEHVGQRIESMQMSQLPEIRQATSSVITTPNIIQETESAMGLAEQASENRLGLDEPGGHSSLPEDDGMGMLREKIHAIRDLNYRSADQARMIHELMTENYNASRSTIDIQTVQPALSRSGPRSPDIPGTPNFREKGESFEQRTMTPSTTASPVRRGCRYGLTDQDLNPTFFPKEEPESPLDDFDDTDAEEFEKACLGCQHYKRNVKLQCYDCKKWYTCRFCHDGVEDHHLNRPKTENMLCMFCGHAQPAAQLCRRCGGQSAQYYCNICKLWDNDTSKSIYHCNDCGICRIGQGLGKDFFHCKTCCVCLPISIENTHRCIERSTQCDCPICGDYMFTSPETVVFMRCGHSIHQKCLVEHSKRSYRCPICSKTITNMESTFRNLDRTIQSQPMPPEFKGTKALIYCNDCGAKSVVKYHWLGLKCDMCESYNTAQNRLLHGDVLDSGEESNGGRYPLTNRTRSSSQGDEAVLPMLTSLRLNTTAMTTTTTTTTTTSTTTTTTTTPDASPIPGAPLSAEPDGRFSSYSISRGRAVSPVISNYFGIPTDRGTERPLSTSLFGRQSSRERENDDGGELRFWGTKFKYRYGFLSRETDSIDGTSEPNDEEGDDDEGGSWCTDSDEDKDGEEDEEDIEGIDLFGHR
ncbi:hypothetical protein BDV25DRAFT_160777 [Aspergillus avenaceus]|uniref:Uncharacterized protein n=1 Tax=Aspergillus avenaceus TaxID=36643 RepID=A0A5N6TLN7_ASPAV|nr:hypothetical protein BDV25DRAFT_160777 [Aspergillus avenaceus]